MNSASTSKNGQIVPNESGLSIEHARFSDMGAYGQAIGWDIDFRQIEPGRLEADAKVLAMPDSAIVGVEFNRGFHQLGAPPGEFLTFGLPAASVGEFRWCGAVARGGSLINFNLESGFEGVTGNGFRGYTVSISRNRLQRLARTFELETPIDHLIRHRAVWANFAPHVLQYLEHGFQTWARDDLLFSEHEEFFSDEVALSILETLLADQQKNAIEDQLQDNRALGRALEYIHDPENLPVSVAELCLKIGTSQSTLRRAFAERFRLTPKAYIRARCLSGVRDQLSLCPGGTRVADVANQWGFWHMGQFARDFRKMFGALPSAFLAESVRRELAT